jgi:hypothetical protein
LYTSSSGNAYGRPAGEEAGSQMKISEEKTMMLGRLCKNNRYEMQWFTGAKEPLIVMPVSAEQIHAASVGKITRSLCR